MQSRSLAKEPKCIVEIFGHFTHFLYILALYSLHLFAVYLLMAILLA